MSRLGVDATARNWVVGELAQIGVVTDDLEAAIDAYARLGLGPFARLDTDYHARFRGVQVHIANRNAFAAWSETLHIEIVEPGVGDGPQKTWLRERGPGVFHIGYATDDVKQRPTGVEVAFEVLDSAIVFLDTVHDLGYYVELFTRATVARIRARIDATAPG